MYDVALGRLMGAIIKNIEVQFKNKLSDYDINSDLNFSYFQYLIVISAHNGVNQNELAKRMNVGKGSASKAVKYLLQKNLVFRKQDELDTRIKNVYITEEGKEIAYKFKTVFFELNAKISEGFSEFEVSILKKLLQRIYKNTAVDDNNYILDDLYFLDEQDYSKL